MGHIDISRITHQLPDGRILLDEVSFRVGEGTTAALVGPNGAGKTTLLRLAAGDLPIQSGAVTVSGGLGVMRQFIGSVRDETTVRDLLVSLAHPSLRAVDERVRTATAAFEASPDEERTQMRYAQALADWGDAGGYDAEVVWDICTMAAFDIPWERAADRLVATLSGGEQKRLALEALLRGHDEVLLLDEPDNYLDVPGKRWLEEQLQLTNKTVLLVSHDRELLANAARQIITVEGGRVWVHGGGFASYHEARAHRHARQEELVRRWEEERDRLVALVRTLQQQAAISPDMASRYHAMQTRLRRFEDAGPPDAPPPPQNLRMRLKGGRTGVRAIVANDLELYGLTDPFSTEIDYGDRVAVLGPNGTGKSHFLRLLAMGPDAKPTEPGYVEHEGAFKIGARVVAGHFVQTHAHPEWIGQTLVEILADEARKPRGEAIGALRRYGIHHAADQRFESLSGGQQARFQVLLLELSGATMLLLDEPTDNLDLDSAEALQEALEQYEGTVLAVTHDRWFTRSFDRVLVFGDDGRVTEHPAPVWEY
jgi:ATPase subunit of ABC transporter with duplicated ATPase domains